MVGGDIIEANIYHGNEKPGNIYNQYLIFCLFLLHHNQFNHTNKKLKQI